MECQHPFPFDAVALPATGTITRTNITGRRRLYLNGVPTNTIYMDGVPTTPPETIHAGDVISLRAED